MDLILFAVFLNTRGIHKIYGKWAVTKVQIYFIFCPKIKYYKCIYTNSLKDPLFWGRSTNLILLVVLYPCSILRCLSWKDTEVAQPQRQGACPGGCVSCGQREPGPAQGFLGSHEEIPRGLPRYRPGCQCRHGTQEWISIIPQDGAQ